MILMSPTADISQATPVTTTYEPAGRLRDIWARHRSRRRALHASSPHHQRLPSTDWDRIEELYGFCQARATDRLHEAEQQHEREEARRARHAQGILEAMRAQANKHDNAVVQACAVTYFRTQAMRDAPHPDFLGEWITPSRRPI
jgi:hypothetical protein